MFRRFYVVMLWLACLSSAGVVYAQNNRSAVSVTGVDTATCTVPDPCRTFGVALSRTNTGGEVVALDSGGYGPFSVDKSATIVAAPGIYAALVATSGTNAVTINSGTGGRVVIRGLNLYGMGSGNSGVSVTGSGQETHIENCTIDNFGSNGIIGFLNFTVSDTVIRNCNGGVWVDNAGGPVKASLERVQIKDGKGSYAVFSFRNAHVTIRNSASLRTAGVGFHAEGGGKMVIENTISTGALDGFRVQGTGSVMSVSNCVATDNTRGFTIVSPAVMETWSNNKLTGNGTNVSGTLTPVTPQ